MVGKPDRRIPGGAPDGDAQDGPDAPQCQVGHLNLGHLAGDKTWIADDLDLPDADSVQEKEADYFATQVLLPEDFDLSSRTRLSSGDVIRYASDHGVHPAIVAGRIQHEKKDFRTFANLLGRGGVRMHFTPAGKRWGG